MATPRDARVLLATDGSPQARTALAVAIAFPWPRGTGVDAVVARSGFVPLAAAAAEWPASVWAALDAQIDGVVDRTRRALRRRWPDAEVRVAEGPTVDAIVGEARRTRAQAIVVGSHGYGLIPRLLLGSVSRGVVRRAACPVLVARGQARRARRILVGIDGSDHARRAARFVAGLERRPGCRAVLAAVVEPERVPGMSLVPASIQAAIRGQAVRLEAERLRAAERAVAAAATQIRRAGWSVETRVITGVPLDALLSLAIEAKADALVLGARGVGGIERLLLGSVAEGALTRAPVPVLIVK